MEKAIDSGKVTGQDLATLHYLVGELDRRQARFDEALASFDKAAKDPSPGPVFDKYLNDMRALAEKKDDNNSIS